MYAWAGGRCDWFGGVENATTSTHVASRMRCNSTCRRKGPTGRSGTDIQTQGEVRRRNRLHVKGDHQVLCGEALDSPRKSGDDLKIFRLTRRKYYVEF